MKAFIYRLLDCFEYDSPCGKLYWPESYKNKWLAGKEAGHLHRDKDKKTTYRRLNFEGKSYYVHRLIWLIETGNWPKGTIDHKDNDGLNNPFNNLRDTTPMLQNFNRTVFKCSKTGICGVTIRGSNFKALAIVNREKFNLYSGKDFFLACCARKSFDNKIGDLI